MKERTKEGLCAGCVFGTERGGNHGSKGDVNPNKRLKLRKGGKEGVLFLLQF